MLDNVPFTQAGKSVVCYLGYSEDNGYCRYCDCGLMGRCSFENGEKYVTAMQVTFPKTEHAKNVIAVKWGILFL
ncbi:hypothetical protein CEXT_254431 [Caerostris extrusa]|uniref:Uncharacterized protein n=1 Tax=Caerostris extrusa TaxID=172846 RepID=A0AAV4T3B4_CAEEX|nr:hypothetical protein CEXT_254431 [Caerostris extrusa]